MQTKAKELTKLYEDISRKGIKMSEKELVRSIFEFAMEKEDDLMLLLKKKRSEEILKDWLKQTVDGEATDSVKEHDLVL